MISCLQTYLKLSTFFSRWKIYLILGLVGRPPVKRLKNFKVLYPLGTRPIPNFFFCSSSLPQAITIWFQSTFSSHCSLSSKQCYWLAPATSKMVSSEKNWERWESNPGKLGPYASMLSIVLCCPLITIIFILFLPTFSQRSVLWLDPCGGVIF